MYLLHRDIHVDVLKECPILRAGNQLLVVALKHFRVGSVVAHTVRVVIAVIRHAVDKKQAQDLDALFIKYQLLVQMLLDGLADLLLFDGHIVHVAHGVADAENVRLRGKADILVSRFAVDFVDDIALINGAVAELLFGEVVALTDRDVLALYGAIRLAVQLDFRRDGRFFIVHAQKLHVGSVVVIDALKAGDLDLLDELHVEGVHCVELVNLVVLHDMGGGVAQRTHGVERSHCLFGGRRALALHRLGLVHDDEGVRLFYQVDGTAPVELVVLAVDDVGLALLVRVVKALAEGVDVDDHDGDVVADRKGAHLLELVAVIDKIVVDGVVVEIFKMFLRDLQGFVHALLDGNAGHNDDKLGKAVSLV